MVKAGGVVVATMPLLRAKDLEPIINKAELKLALCDERLESDLIRAVDLAPNLQRICCFNGADENSDSELEQTSS